MDSQKMSKLKELDRAGLSPEETRRAGPERPPFRAMPNKLIQGGEKSELDLDMILDLDLDLTTLPS